MDFKEALHVHLIFNCFAQISYPTLAVPINAIIKACAQPQIPVSALLNKMAILLLPTVITGHLKMMAMGTKVAAKMTMVIIHLPNSCSTFLETALLKMVSQLE